MIHTMKSDFENVDNALRIFYKTEPRLIRKMFTGSEQRIDNAMQFLWKHFSGWPGFTTFEYDRVRAIICAVLLSTRDSDFEFSNGVDALIKKHDRWQSLGQVSSLEDVTCEMCGFDPVAFVMMEDTLLRGFIENFRPDIDPAMSSCGWTGCYNYKGLTNVLFKNRCETLVDMAARYMRNTPQKWIDTVRETYSIRDVYQAIQFIALVDDAAGYEYYSVSEEDEQIAMLFMAAINIDEQFDINRARNIGGEIAVSRVTSKGDFYLEVWKDNTILAPSVCMTRDELEMILRFS